MLGGDMVGSVGSSMIVSWIDGNGGMGSVVWVVFCFLDLGGCFFSLWLAMYNVSSIAIVIVWVTLAVSFR